MSELTPCCLSSNDETGSRKGIPELRTDLNRKDRIDGWKVRWGIGRMNCSVRPGLYQVNRPDADSPVLVTANYKLTVDQLRKELNDIKAWILVLDTRGINVWCAAGKGTFGTDELVHRIREVQLDQIVNHRKLIVPQLGAPGIAGHEVKKQSGFKVEYGPIYAKDMHQYIGNGFKIRPEMRRVRFTLHDRLILIPMELIPALRLIPFMMLWILILQLIRDHRLSLSFFSELTPFLIAILAGSVLFQILLPIIPFRSFVLGGWFLGGLVALGFSVMADHPTSLIVINMLMLPPITAFLAVNFTGTTTFTSLSGVQKELAVGVPLMILSILSGMIYQIVTLV